MHKPLTPLLAVAALAAHSVYADFARQFRAKDIRNDGTWPSFSHKAVMSAVHSDNSNGWIHAVADKTIRPFGAVSFETTPQGTPSPFVFDRNNTTQFVSHAFVVVYADSEPSAMSTLISAPSVPLMLEPEFANTLFDTPPFSREFITEFYGESSEVGVDGANKPLFTSSDRPKLVHCHWETPQPASCLFVGNSPANRLWQREWKGSGIAEIILAGELDAGSVNAIKRYVSAVFGIRNISYSDPDVPSILRSLGMDNLPFGTLTIIR